VGFSLGGSNPLTRTNNINAFRILKNLGVSMEQ